MAPLRLPLLNDRHTHISFYAALGGAANLSSCAALKDALAVLKQRAAPLVIATGWKNNHYDLPRAELDRLGPVAVCNVSFHSFRLNGPARKLLEADYPEIIAGIDDQDWVERNLPRVSALFAAPGGTEMIPGYLADLAGLGIWAAGDMMVTSGAAAQFLKKNYPGRADCWAGFEDYKKMNANGRAAVRGLKLFADGAVGARTAALTRGYKGGGKGLLLHSAKELKELVKAAAGLTGRLAVHAIGDAALEQVISALEKLKIPAESLQVRIEHAQFITGDQARRAKKLGASLCMQPNFSYDSAVYADRLPARYLRGNNPFRLLIDKAGFVPGEDLFFGSDGMPHGAAPALQAALFPPLAGQRLKLREFIAGYCLPDFSNGWIDATIDERKKKVCVKVVLGAAAGR